MGRARSLAAALHGAGAKTHVAFDVVPPPPHPPALFSFGFFSSPSLKVARPKPEISTYGSAKPRAGRDTHYSSTTREPARRKPQRQIDEKHRRVSNFGSNDRLPIPGSAEPQTLYAASRELPNRVLGAPAAGSRGRGRQAQAAPAPPLRLPPLRLPIYIHLPTAGAARTIYSSGAAGSSQPGTILPAWTCICDRRPDARGRGEPRCTHPKVFPSFQPPGASGSLPDSPVSWGAGQVSARGALRRPAEHLPGLKRPVQSERLRGQMPPQEE